MLVASPNHGGSRASGQCRRSAVRRGRSCRPPDHHVLAAGLLAAVPGLGQQPRADLASLLPRGTHTPPSGILGGGLFVHWLDSQRDSASDRQPPGER